MDIIPGPRRPKFPHAEVPFLCGDEPFPNEQDYIYDTRNSPWGYDMSSLSQAIMEKHPFLVSFKMFVRLFVSIHTNTYYCEDMTAKPIDRSLPTFYDIHPQEHDANEFKQLRHSSPMATNNLSEGAQQLSDQASGENARQALSALANSDDPNIVRWQGIFTLNEGIREETLPEATRPSNRKEYDGQGFQGFPQRQGWDDTLLQYGWESEEYRRFFRQKSPLETAIFIQAWLYFGMLSEVLGKNIRTNDFVTKNRQGFQIITLQKFITNRQWVSWHDDLIRLPKEQKQTRVERIEYCLTQAKNFTRLEERGHLEGIPFADSLALSIRVLGILLGDVCDNHPEKTFTRRFNDSLGCEAWGLGGIIRRRMKLSQPTHSNDEINRKGWCINEVARLKRSLPETAMYYMSTMPRLTGNLAMGGANERLVDHSKCSETSCVVNSIDEKNYVTEHFLCCNGDCEFVGPDMTIVENILQRGGIPLIQFSNDNPTEGLFTDVEEDYNRAVKGVNTVFSGVQMKALEKHTRNLISLVPGGADPANSNIIIQGVPDVDPKILTATKPSFKVIEYNGNSPFVAISHVWSDGLGNVKNNTLPTCRIPFLRRAIWQTNAPIELYPGKELDPSQSQALAEYSKQYYEMLDRQDLIRLHRDPIPLFWLDTFCVPRNSPLKKEALRKMGYTYRAASKVLVLDGTMGGFAMGGYGNGTHCGPRSYSECLAWILAAPWMRRLWTLQEGLMARKLLVMFSEGPVDVRNLVKGVESNAKNLNPGDIVERQLAQGALQLLDFSKRDSQSRFVEAWNASITRVASKEGDTSLCLASTLSMDAATLFSTPVPDRARVFYSMLSKIPQSMLFSCAEKLCDVGYRWADASLGRVPFEIGSRFADVQKEPCGLIVVYPGYLFSSEILDLTPRKFYCFDQAEQLWLKAEVLSTFTETLPYHIFSGLIVENDDDWETQRRYDRPKKATIVIFNESKLQHKLQQTEVVIVGYALLRIASKADLGFEEQENTMETTRPDRTTVYIPALPSTRLVEQPWLVT